MIGFLDEFSKVLERIFLERILPSSCLDTSLISCVRETKNMTSHERNNWIPTEPFNCYACCINQLQTYYGVLGSNLCENHSIQYID